jgi:hypothetical protein
MASTGYPYTAIGWVLFFLALAVFVVYHVSHGFPGLDIMIR